MPVTAFPTGKRIADGIEEYPFVQKPGIKDYVFYFVSNSDGYGKMARIFFNKYYPKHKSKEVGTLEDLINFLDAEIQAQTVSAIREIVIVCHGNPIALLLPLVEGSLAGDLAIYKNLHIFSLNRLQEDFKANKLAAFNTKRKRVIAKLKEGSTVTLRACNFGQAKAGMYALYSFFGGRANLYAPAVYQAFATMPVAEGMKIESNLEMHEHLVKQRFLPKDIHTDDRKDILSRFFSDPGKFAEPFVIASSKLADTTSAQAIEYQDLVDTLNAQRASDLLKEKFSANDMELSAAANVKRIIRDASWIIDDKVVHEGQTFNIEYSMKERVENVTPDNQKTAFLDVEARLMAEAVRAGFHIQIFLDETDRDAMAGKLFVLATHNPEEPQANQQFTDLQNHLNTQNKAGALIAGLFEENSITVSPDTEITLKSTSGSGEFVRKTWELASTPKHLIKLEHPANADLSRTHILAVYLSMTEAEQTKYAFEQLSSRGIDLDNPGTELMAYLDRFTLEQLLELMSYLRENYKQENVIYLDHAAKAIQRKKGFADWLTSQPEFLNSDLPFFILPNELSMSERDDIRGLVYEFETNLHWKEVCMSNPSPITITEATDLFTEELLKERLKLGDEIFASDEMEIDSPYADIKVLRELGPAELEKFFDKDQYLPDPPADTRDISCEEFRLLFEKLKSLNGSSDAVIEEALENMVIAEDKALGYYLKNIYKSVTTAFKFINAIKGVGGIPETIVTRFLIPRFPALATGPALGAPFLVTITRALPYVGIVTFVWEMFANYIREFENTQRHWEQRGKLVAIRQWARRLYGLSIIREDDFPEDIQINLVEYAGVLRSLYHGLTFVNHEYFVTLYYKEQIDMAGGALTYHAFIFAPDRMKKGFDEGAVLIEKEANEILAKSENILNDALRQEGLEPCKIAALKDTGFISMAKVRALIMRQYAELILEKTPNV